jgi:dephospho-CoA kinase
MIVIGVTGPIATGKSTVDGMLRDLGADPVIDGDRVVHELYRDSRPLREQLVALFGPEIVGADGAIDRGALGARVFGDLAALRRLEEVAHPAVRAEVRARLEAAAEARPDGVAVVDAVKLLQGDLARLCAERWWVAASSAEQLRRLVEIRGYSAEEAGRRLAAQPRLEDWRHAVDRVIDNAGSLEDTRRQVEAGWRDLMGQ